MASADKVVTADSSSSVQEVLDLMVSKQVGAVVIICTKEDDKEKSIPVGIITKTDILHAYRHRVDLNESCKRIIRENSLVTCKPDDDRDKVASILERNKMHHVIVVRGDHFDGIVSSWDIAVECSKDSRAWPYLRSEDGSINFPRFEESALPPAFNPEEAVSILNHKHDDTFVDFLDVEAFQ
eukprot:scaffold5_cov144-Skeletonema_menzelii.AAC.20